MRRRITLLIMAAMLAMALVAPAALAAPLPDNCTKDQGTVTCTEGPGRNQGGVGTADETQGNTKNKAPAEQQDLADNECTQGSPGLCKQAERQ
jgi:Spy/CpxP family protein refolding chaperone